MSTTADTYNLTFNAPPPPASEPVMMDKVGIAESSETIYFIPRGYSWDNAWCLAIDLLVQVCASWEEIVATTYLTVQEYGLGTSFEEAIYDLMTSLSDYRQSLESRRDRLGPRESADLAKLHRLLTPEPIP
jgi:hypothetical protein